MALLTLGQACAAASASGQRVVKLPAHHATEAITYQATPEFDLHVIRELIHARVNRARRSSGRTALKLDAGLNALAHAHSQDMAARGFFSHTNLRGETASVRASRAGKVCTSEADARFRRPVGENLYTGFAYESYRLIYRRNSTEVEFDWSTEAEIARMVVDGWLASPGHRANLMDERYAAHGIGIVLKNTLEILVTQNLC